MGNTTPESAAASRIMRVEVSADGRLRSLVYNRCFIFAHIRFWERLTES